MGLLFILLCSFTSIFFGNAQKFQGYFLKFIFFIKKNDLVKGLCWIFCLIFGFTLFIVLLVYGVLDKLEGAGTSNNLEC